MSTSLPSLRERATQTLIDIERHFALGGGLYREKAGANNAAFNWSLGILLSAYVAAARWDKNRYGPRVAALSAALNQHYWRTDAPVGGYNASPSGGGNGPDRYYDDNAWLALAWGEAGAEYVALARRALHFCLSGYDTALGGGIWWHEQEKKSKNTCATAPVAVACLTVAGDSVMARRLYTWGYDLLRDPADGLYWDAIRVETRQIARDKWSYNSALPLRLELLLWERWRAPVYRDRAAALADACCNHWFDRAQGILSDDASFAHLLCENLLRAAAVVGNKRAQEVAFTSLDTLWAQVRRPDGSYPKRWDTKHRETSPTELLWIASAARAYAFAASWQEKPDL